MSRFPDCTSLSIELYQSSTEIPWGPFESTREGYPLRAILGPRLEGASDSVTYRVFYVPANTRSRLSYSSVLTANC